jgi:hypothetical protein
LRQIPISRPAGTKPGVATASYARMHRLDLLLQLLAEAVSPPYGSENALRWSACEQDANRPITESHFEGNELLLRALKNQILVARNLAREPPTLDAHQTHAVENAGHF